MTDTNFENLLSETSDAVDYLLGRNYVDFSDELVDSNESLIFKVLSIPDSTVHYYVLSFHNGCTVYRQADWRCDMEIMMDFPYTISYIDVVQFVQRNINLGIFV